MCRFSKIEKIAKSLHPTSEGHRDFPILFYISH